MLSLFYIPTPSLSPFLTIPTCRIISAINISFFQSPVLIIQILFFFWYYFTSNFWCYYTLLLQFQMPRKGQKHKLHSTEDLEKAIEKVRTGHLSYQQAHEIYGVPKSTISDQINRHSMKSEPNKSGPQCHLSPEIEEHIYKWLLKMARIGYGQTKPDLFDRVQIIIHCLKIPIPFVDNHPGEKWYRLFLNLALWQAQLLSKLCAGVLRQAIND